MGIGLPLSVVICTYNRAESLKRAIESLGRQSYRNFDVVVVNGPSNDGTEEILRQLAETIQIVRCSEKSVAAARNVGIDTAQGEILAFMDDDAVAHPDWLNKLQSVYSDPTLAAAGGPVIDGATGEVAYEVCMCRRAGDVSSWPFSELSDVHVRPRADPFLYLAGCNMSFRRSVLVAMGGFDEAFEYGYEDAEMCSRIIDAANKIEFVRDAIVYHYPLANVVRNLNHVHRDVYPFIQSRTVFALRSSSDPAKAMSSSQCPCQ